MYCLCLCMCFVHPGGAWDKVNNASMWVLVCSHSLDAVSVCFVLHDGVWWQVEDSAKRVSDASSSGLITCCFVPDRNDILLDTHIHTYTHMPTSFKPSTLKDTKQ